MALFAIWVVSPFLVLLLACARSSRWADLTRATLSILTLVLTPVSLAIYANVALGAPRQKLAFVFVVMPPASWLSIAILIAIAALASGRKHSDA